MNDAGWSRDPHIVLVEDEPSIARVLTRLLATRGYTDVTTESRPEGLLEPGRLAQTDLVLMDLHIPGCDTFSVMTRLREASADLPFVPLLAMSGDSSDPMRDKALASGATDFIAKPFEMEDLMGRVKAALAARASALAA